jgi:hypothetical protein
MLSQLPSTVGISLSWGFLMWSDVGKIEWAFVDGPKGELAHAEE